MDMKNLERLITDDTTEEKKKGIHNYETVHFSYHHFLLVDK